MNEDESVLLKETLLSQVEVSKIYVSQYLDSSLILDQYVSLLSDHRL
jgi:hypothetical protein